MSHEDLTAEEHARLLSHLVEADLGSNLDRKIAEQARQGKGKALAVGLLAVLVGIAVLVGAALIAPSYSQTAELDTVAPVALSIFPTAAATVDSTKNADGVAPRLGSISPPPTSTISPTSTPVPTAELPVPSGLRETNQGIDTSGRPFIGLGWSKPPGVSIVEVERDGVVIAQDDNLALRDIPDPALTAGQIVTYRIRSVSEEQASDWSNPVTVTVARL